MSNKRDSLGDRMKNNYENIKPIEVEFYDVIEPSDYQEKDINKLSSKLPLKVISALLQKKAKSTLNNKAKVIRKI